MLWDVAWHLTVGRERFLSPPHVLMCSAVAVNGFIAAWAVVYASFRNADGFGAPVSRGRELNPRPTDYESSQGDLFDRWHASSG